MGIVVICAGMYWNERFVARERWDCCSGGAEMEMKEVERGRIE